MAHPQVTTRESTSRDVSFQAPAFDRKPAEPAALPSTAPASPGDRATVAGADLQEALPPGARLDEFEIVRVLGVGGFGIVYLATDQLLQRQVAIKEYIPTALARRASGGGVEVRSDAAAETFSIGLESFYNEGRLLARFDHPSLVKAFRFWKAHGTAYMAMQYYPGMTLKDARRRMGSAPDERWLRAFVDGLLGALDTLHRQGVYHRDIAPDNILLLPDGQPVILDFGSARRVIGDRTQSLTALLKPNYSPVEQYADEAGMRQGAHTDFYALGGTVYFMLTGRDPVPAVMRAVRDTFPLLRQAVVDADRRVSRNFLAVIDWMLAVSPDDRPRTVGAVRLALDGKLEPPPPTERHGVVIADASATDDPARASAPTQRVAAKSPSAANDGLVGAPPFEPTDAKRPPAGGDMPKAALSGAGVERASPGADPRAISAAEAPPAFAADAQPASAAALLPPAAADVRSSPIAVDTGSSPLADVDTATARAPRGKAGWTGLAASLGVLALVGWGAWATLESVAAGPPTPSSTGPASKPVQTPAPVGSMAPAPVAAAGVGTAAVRAAASSLDAAPKPTLRSVRPPEVAVSSGSTLMAASTLPSAPASTLPAGAKPAPESAMPAARAVSITTSTAAAEIPTPSGRTAPRALPPSGAVTGARESPPAKKAEVPAPPLAGHADGARIGDASAESPIVSHAGSSLTAMPAALCVSDNVFARGTCLARACDSPQARAHPQCVEARRLSEQRQRRMEQ